MQGVQVIPDAAIEAVAEAIYKSEGRDYPDWASHSEGLRNNYRTQAKTYLEAAAPYMQRIMCASSHHAPPVPATAHGAFKSYWNSDNSDPDVWYCERCAATGQSVGIFERDKP